MSSAAQREDMPEQDVSLANGTDGAVALRQIAAERLAAHRQRRAGLEETQRHRDEMVAQARLAQRGKSGVSRVRDAVAARYQQSLSYHEFLAAEAERALQQARAEAEVAARNAVAVEQAQRQLMEEIEQWNQPGPGPVAVEALPVAAEPVQVARRRAAVETEPTKLKVQMYSDLPAPLGAEPMELRNNAVVEPHADLEELGDLDQEIAFRMAPEFREHVIVETQPIQANIIEFPRQLVAPRKARPRLAEGPLREDGTPEPQLRIFEVEPEQISVEAVSVETTAAPEWQSLLLASAPLAATAVDVAVEAQATIELHPAPVSRRVLAAVVDAVCIGAAMVGFVAVVAEIAGPALRELTLPMLGGAVAGPLAVFVLLYKLLFFTLNESTPGMRYARIGFCTFRDSNPTRKALRLRTLWTALAVLPLGMGLMWLLLDSDRMGWHDRMSRMYPRAY